MAEQTIATIIGDYAYGYSMSHAGYTQQALKIKDIIPPQGLEYLARRIVEHIRAKQIPNDL